jgi:hypothetical protein
MSSAEFVEMERLLSALCDGEIAAGEHARLEKLLQTDAGCRRMYLEYMDLHGALLMRCQQGTLFAGSPRGDSVCPLPTALKAIPSSHANSSQTVRRPSPVLRVYQGFLVALATLAVSILVQVYWWHPGSLATALVARAKDGPEAALAKEPATIATLKQALDCDWSRAPAPLEVGARLSAGPFSLAKGIAYVQFDSGAELVVQGPAELRLDSGTAVTVLAGKVVFRSDESAAPFDLVTPNSIFGETASEFAVAVGTDSEEVHVFEGAVERRSSAAAGKGKSERLKAGEAWSYQNKGLASQGKPTKIDPHGFVRHITPERATPDRTAGLCAYEGFDYRSAAVLAMGRANGGIGWVGPWKLGFTRSAAEGERPRLPFGQRENLSRADQATPSVGGSFDFVGYTKCSRRLGTPIRLDTDMNYYLSFLFHRHGPATDPANTLGVIFWTGEDYQTQRFEDARQRLFIGVKSADQLSTRFQNLDAEAPLSLRPGSTYLLAAKIAARRTGADRMYVRVYGPDEPIDAGEPTKWSLASPPFQGELTFDWLQLHINSKARQTMDEIRLGTTWASVTSAYVPAN